MILFNKLRSIGCILTFHSQNRPSYSSSVEGRDGPVNCTDFSLGTLADEVLFCIQKILHLLATSHQFFADGTFKPTPSYSTDSLLLKAIHFQRVMPLVLALLPDRKLHAGICWKPSKTMLSIGQMEANPHLSNYWGGPSLPSPPMNFRLLKQRLSRVTCSPNSNFNIPAYGRE